MENKRAKEQIMRELLDRYQQLESINHDERTVIVLSEYIKKLENKLITELKND